MTTVGYGDLVPITAGGKVVAAMASVCGIIVLAFPISMIIDKFAESTGEWYGDEFVMNMQHHRRLIWISRLLFMAYQKSFPLSAVTTSLVKRQKRATNFFLAGLNPSFILSLYVDQSFENSNWQQCSPIQLNQPLQCQDDEWMLLDPAAFGQLEQEMMENPFMSMDSNNLYETVFLTGPLPPPPPLKNVSKNTALRLKENPLNQAQVKAPSKQFYHSNMVQQPFYYPYRDKIVVTGKQIIQDPLRVSNTSVPQHPSTTTVYDSTATPLNYTSPYTSAAATYIDTNCCTQSSPVAQVPSISGTSFDLGDYYTSSSNCFEPIYYPSDASLCQEYPPTTSEKSVDDWIHYLHSDDEGTSLEEPLGINCDSLFPEFAEEDLTMLDTILAEETFAEEVDLPFHPQQDMPAGSSAASPQNQYLPEQSQQQQTIQFIPIAPKPADLRPSQSLSPTSSTSSTTTESRSRKRQRIQFNNSEEEYRIKRDLNNLASAKSRQKKREKQEFMKLEKVRLESRNRQLKNEVEEFERQIATLKDILYSKIKK